MPWLLSNDSLFTKSSVSNDNIRIWTFESPLIMVKYVHTHFNQQRTVINTQTKTNKMHPSIETITGNVDEEISLVIIKAF